MIYVSLPDHVMRPLPFYLAMEEFLAKKCDMAEDLFFMWQVNPTVIFGRNQIINREVNLEYCREHGIEVFRRRSGGGCVYADMSNIMFSCITTSGSSVTTTFSHYTSQVAGMLRSLGMDASATSRNDILIGDRKVSGNAFYHIPGRSIVHGTMLYDTDMINMSQAITPSVSKLKAKGVDSVRAHITTLKEYTDLDIESFKIYARKYMCSGEMRLADKDIRDIEVLERPYHDPVWIYGKSLKEASECNCRVEGVGEFQVRVATDKSRITGVDLAGDFFLTGDIDSLITDRLLGVEYNPAAVEEALVDVNPGNVIHGLTTKQLINLLFENGTE